MQSREKSVGINTKPTGKGFQNVARVQILSIAVDEAVIGEGTKRPVSIQDQPNRRWRIYLSPGQGPRESLGPGAL